MKTASRVLATGTRNWRPLVYLLSAASVSFGIGVGYLHLDDDDGTGGPPAVVATVETSTTEPSTTEPSTTEPQRNGASWMGGIDEVYRGTGETTVAIIGDSLTVSTSDLLRAELSGYRVKIAAFFGEGFGGGSFSHVFGTNLLADALHDYLDDADPPDVLVIALGTNDAWLPALTSSMFQDQWPEMAEDYHGPCLVVVTVSESVDAPTYDVTEAAQINEGLRAHADRVVDWATLHRPEHLKPDQIHLTAEGRAYRARLIADAVESCARADR